jgi:hypothetical protein
VLECIVMVVVRDELIVWSWYSVQMVEAVDDARLFSGGEECYIEVVVDAFPNIKMFLGCVCEWIKVEIVETC